MLTRYPKVQPGTLPSEDVFRTELEREAQRISVARTRVQMLCEKQGILGPGQRIKWKYPYEIWGVRDKGTLPDGRVITFELLEQYELQDVAGELPHRIPWHSLSTKRTGNTKHSEIYYRMELSLE